jgi:hypothetical protein
MERMAGDVEKREVSTGGHGREAEAEKVIPGRRIIGTAQGQGVYIKGRLHTDAFATTICRCNGVSGETPCQEVRAGKVSGIPHR